ncbi:GNAT family N-acetyltransferase [Streptomyces sp. NPDC055089]
MSDTITIRPVRASEIDEFRRLTLLIDLKIPADKVPNVFTAMHMALQHEGAPFTHGVNQFLFAETQDGTPVAAVHTGPPTWMFRHPHIPRHMRTQLLKRISNIDTLAVHPDYRGQGIARSILARVETDFRNAGYHALTLRHEHHNKHFFTHHGYTTLPQLALDLPPVGLVTESDRTWKYAAKPLTDQVTFTTTRGRTALTGLVH